ncbi:putative glycoside hydrolase [Oceanobacillus massiliensis]|uniref:putative glycoside hydrolase n=1 Tax=Oceanobacillus massiliensis TaxID=1465765 RepID=UPI0002896EE8|nr:putative glycoside hydrolase [Oceanobacillus massiliensis]
MRKWQLTTVLVGIFLLGTVITIYASGEDMLANVHKERQTSIQKIDSSKLMERFTYDTEYNFEYPDAVRGVYVTGNSAGTGKFDSLLNLMDETALNSMVIDVKEDSGHLTFMPEDASEDIKDAATNTIQDPKAMMEELEKEQIYPIARIVVFKDSVLAEKRPDLSFTENGEVWTNNNGDAFVNPFEKEVWEYNLEIAKKAAEMGFQEIQFDYVRFPEGFENMDEELDYSLGDYENMDLNNIKKRVEAVSDFVAYANKELEQYDVDVSVDIFGYAATLEETPGIGQNFSRISENVDVISSMIYPSHWSSYFGIEKPDTEPYRLISEYAKVENEVLGKLDNPPVSRPWLQDFEAPWLYSGETKQYGKAEVEAQIKALYENGIDEFLLWNAGNTYTENVDYMIGK